MCTTTDVRTTQTTLIPTALQAAKQTSEQPRMPRRMAAAMLGAVGTAMLQVKPDLAHSQVSRCNIDYYLKSRIPYTICAESQTA